MRRPRGGRLPRRRAQGEGNPLQPGPGPAQERPQAALTLHQLRRGDGRRRARARPAFAHPPRPHALARVARLARLLRRLRRLLRGRRRRRDGRRNGGRARRLPDQGPQVGSHLLHRGPKAPGAGGQDVLHFLRHPERDLHEREGFPAGSVRRGRERLRGGVGGRGAQHSAQGDCRGRRDARLHHAANGGAERGQLERAELSEHGDGGRAPQFAAVGRAQAGELFAADGRVPARLL
mmetsp:Transcript_22298/g.72325  ORF Transcript_22298/g.72325 Transcript_22298/m.72325 type:complete len:235 (-) Transcript_22298:2168-2872(-)